ncbi:MAG: hypothetical protein H7Y17_09080 [Chlorobia bacterium]|nr:hypothetical protein [Fimbriimonadaceae bacterium]
MPQSASNLRPYKGPAIVLALATTLIVALAIPRAINFEPVKQPTILKSLWAADVKRSEFQVGDHVKVGDLMLVLTDPALEAEVARLENELKLAQLGTKEAVADSGMLGMIGSLPRVIWEMPSKPIAKGPIEPKTMAATTPSAAPEVSALEKQADQLVSSSFNKEIDIEGKNAELQDATVAITLAESSVEPAQTANEASEKDRQRLQKLYDMGAIAKNKLDAGLVSKEQAAQDLEAAKSAVVEAKKKQADLEKELADLKSQLATLKSQLGAVRTKLTEAKSKVKVPIESQRTETPSTIEQKRVRKVVYGTASGVSMEPLEVKLVDSTDPDQAKRIEEIRAKLIGLKAKREVLKIKATVTGRVESIAAASSRVVIGEKLFTIQP